MAIKNLEDKISKDDMATVNDKRHPPDFKPGFEGSSSGDGSEPSFDFDNSDDFGFEFDGFDGFGDNQSSGGNNNSNLFGDNSNDNLFGNTAGDNIFGNNGFGQANGMLGGQGINPAQQEKKPDLLDNMVEYSSKSASSIGKILWELVKSIKLRTLDDLGYYSTNIVYTGVGFIGAGILLSILSIITQVRFIGIAGLGKTILLSGGLCIGLGISALGLAAYMIMSCGRAASTNLADIPDAAKESDDDATEELEDNLDDIFSDLFDEDEDTPDFALNNEPETSSLEESFKNPNKEDSLPNFGNKSFTMSNIELDEYVKDNVQSNTAMNRKRLYDTFKPLFPKNIPEFAHREQIDESDSLYNVMETISLKVLSNLAGLPINEIDSNLESLYQNLFTYELRVKRVRKLNNLPQIATEFENYLKENSKDTSVHVTVDIEGDFYKIVATKGTGGIITLGDCFEQDYCEEYFLNEKHKLPVIVGVDDTGNILLDDAKTFDAMMLAGKPRSGKSWAILSMLMCMMCFNTPEDIGLIIVDPKQSNLFNTLSLMPHVIGLHDGSNILQLMDDLIDNESARRKKLFADNGVDDIWALRDKGIKIPVIYLVIDEYITVRNNLGQASKDLDAKMQTIISQLPSQGIRILFIPHRATGVVNKTNRTMINYKCAVRSDIDDVNDTLDIKKWNRNLTNPGDMAVKTASLEEAVYARSAALSTSDETNTGLITAIAKAFYKMGVDMPDMSSLKVCANRNERAIQDKLRDTDTHRVQYDVNWLKEDD